MSRNHMSMTHPEILAVPSVPWFVQVKIQAPSEKNGGSVDRLPRTGFAASTEDTSTELA